VLFFVDFPVQENMYLAVGLVTRGWKTEVR